MQVLGSQGSTLHNSRYALVLGTTDYQGPTADIDRSGNAHVDQFIHGRAEGPIKMELRG